MLGIRMVLGLVVLSVAAACGPPVEAPDAGSLLDAPVQCSAAADCDDGLYCDGAERCAPGQAGTDARGCVEGEPPCAASVCDESSDRCAAGCIDADGDGAESAACGGDDCDDADPSRAPGRAEVCDAAGRDEDCDGATFGARDADGDGIASAQCCNGRACGEDCDDARRGTNPSVPEVCDGRDNDCDGATDEGLLVASYRDADRDGVGADGLEVAACPGESGFAGAAGDCDDTRADTRPTAAELCDRFDNDCDGTIDERTLEVPWYVDTDGDGWGVISADAAPIDSCAPVAGRTLRLGDCDDADPLRSPTARERCNALDDDCDGRLDYAIATGDTEDDDLDGAPDAACAGAANPDCDDRDPLARPRADGVELCDARDNDCDGTVDEGAAAVSWFADMDGDGAGDPTAPIARCEPVPGRVLRGDDCDDTNAATNPAAVDDCAGQSRVDDDCDGRIDESGVVRALYADADGDGYGAGDALSICSFAVVAASRGGDCDDGRASVNPGAPDGCGGATDVDDDCDGGVDESTGLGTFYRDADGDGYGTGAPVRACVAPAGHALRDGDCDEAEPARNPGRLDDCTARAGIDDDCDARIDEAVRSTTFYRDADGDGFGAATGTAVACTAPSGFVSAATDCDDARATVRPSASEICGNGLDDDCDSDADCADTACAAACEGSVTVLGDGQSANPHALLANPVELTLRDPLGTPLAGITVTLSSVSVTAPGFTQLTNAAGTVRFSLRAGLPVGRETVRFSAPGVLDRSVAVQTVAPPAGTIFSVTSGDGRGSLIERFPGPVWSMRTGANTFGGLPGLSAGADGSIAFGLEGRIFTISPEGRVEQRFAALGGGPLRDGADESSVSLGSSSSQQVALDTRNGLLYFARDWSIWSLDLVTRVVTRVVGTGSPPAAGTGLTAVEGQPARDTPIANVSSLMVNDLGVLVWTNHESPRGVLYRDRAGLTHLLAQQSVPFGPYRLSYSGNVMQVAPIAGSTDVLLLADYDDPSSFIGNRQGIFRVRSDGSPTLLAGGGTNATGEDVPARTVQLHATSAAIGADGTVWFTSDLHRVRRVDPGTGLVRTVAGTRDVSGESGDGGPGIDALLRNPRSLVVRDGHLLFWDGSDNGAYSGTGAIRMIW